jgi:hypothetical protein
MQNNLKTEIDSIINLVCCSASIGYGGILVLGFGEIIEHDNPKLKNIFHSQWEIRTNSASWRLSTGNEIAVGDYDDESLIKDELLSLVGAKLISFLLQPTISDAQFTFENSIVCEIFSTSRNEYSWELIGPSINIEVQPNGQIEKSDSDFIKSLNPDEKMVLIHSEACSQRWKLVIPAKTNENNCRNCCYYRPLQGEFYFWDFDVNQI